VTALPWPAARVCGHAAAAPLPAAELPLAACLRATLATPLVARAALPAFDAAAMDGYAVRGAGPWRVTGCRLAGSTRGDAGALALDEAVEIATGAPVPAGTEAVLPYEAAIRAGDRLEGRAVPGRNLRRTGEDWAAGAELVGVGAPVTPAVLGVASSAGHDVLTVRPRPRVAALITGDEVISHGLPGAGRVRDAVGPMLPGAFHSYGADLTARDYLPDRADELGLALAHSRADLIVTVGTASVGPADHLRGVLRELGAELVVSSVAVRPGHPQLLARLPDQRLVIGLPGNPLAAVAAICTLVGPVVAGLSGRSLPELALTRLTGVRADPRLTRLVVVRAGGGAAEPTGHDRPGTLWGAALGDAFAAVPPAWDGVTPVPLVPLP
jgi:molybdopterin molybdotransferase